MECLLHNIANDGQFFPWLASVNKPVEIFTPTLVFNWLLSIQVVDYANYAPLAAVIIVVRLAKLERYF